MIYTMHNYAGTGKNKTVRVGENSPQARELRKKGTPCPYYLPDCDVTVHSDLPDRKS